MSINILPGMIKNLIAFISLWSITFSVLSQKVSVQVVKSTKAAVSEWQVMDEQYNPVFSGNEYFRDDSAVFSLEAGKRYLFEISVSQVYISDTILYRLYINNEPLLLIRSDIGCGDHFFPFVTGTRQEPSKITGGTSTDISDFPWQVYYEADNYFCGGSIIGDRWILTAAHCTVDDYGNAIPSTKMDVIVGANDPAGGDGKKYYVSEVIVNEGFDFNTLNNDIALLKLSQPINYPNATPIKLVSQKDSASGYTDPGVMSWVTGYGMTRISPPTFPTALQKVQLPIISIAQASTVWPDIPATDMMAGYLNGNKDACSGDSGGPLVVPYGDGFKQAGLVSWGSTRCNTYGAYTRVSHFEKWITEQTGIEISFSPPTPTGDSIICQGVRSSTYNTGNVANATAYEWQLLPLAAGSISGSSATAVVSWDTSFTGAAVVKVRVTRNSSLSDWSELYVHVAKHTRIISQSADTVVCAEQPLNISVISEGYNLVYSWYKNSTLLKSGTSAEVDLPGTSVSNSGIYVCDVNGSCGADLSNPISLTVYPLTRISSLTPDTEVPFGGKTVLTVRSTGHDLTYQWQKDDQQLANGNDSSFVLQLATAKNTGFYKVTVKGTCGTLTSDNVYVYVRKADYTKEPEIYVWPTVTSDEFNIALSDDQSYNVLMFSTTGRLLKDIRGCSYKTTLNVSDMPPGIYIVKVYNNNFRKSIKVLKN